VLPPRDPGSALLSRGGFPRRERTAGGNPARRRGKRKRKKEKKRRSRPRCWKRAPTTKPRLSSTLSPSLPLSSSPFPRSSSGSGNNSNYLTKRHRNTDSIANGSSLRSPHSSVKILCLCACACVRACVCVWERKKEASEWIFSGQFESGLWPQIIIILISFTSAWSIAPPPCHAGFL